MGICIGCNHLQGEGKKTHIFWGGGGEGGMVFGQKYITLLLSCELFIIAISQLFQGVKVLNTEGGGELSNS